VSECTEGLRCWFTDAVVDFVLTAMEIICAGVTGSLRHVTLSGLLDIYCLFSEINLFLDLVKQLLDVRTACRILTPWSRVLLEKLTSLCS
jgi:hypothetical protein